MAYSAPSVDDLFGGLPAEQRVERFEAYKAALSACHQKSLHAAQTGSATFEKGVGIVKHNTVASQAAEFKSNLSKSVSADQLAAVESALAGIADINKDWSLTTPLTGVPYGNIGLVPYNLDPALSMLVPKTFILRNQIPRVGAVGQALEFRRILGVSNSGTGGVANLNTFFNSNSVTSSYGGVTLNRPNKINYAADRIVKSFVEQGVSDSVTMQAEFAGRGYTDLRQLSHTSLLWASMLGEERNMLNARSTSLVAVTTAPTFTAAADTTGTGFPSSFNSQTVAVAVSLSSSFGETAPVSAGTITGVTGNGAKVTYSAALPVGTLAINVYATYSGVTVKATSYNVLSASLLGLSFSTATLPSTDVSYSSIAYDGFVSTLTDTTQTGYNKSLNAALSSSEPGAEFQDAFTALFNLNQADPDFILTTAAIRRSLAKSIQQQGTATGYRLNYETGSDGITIGSVVTAIANESTGKMVDIIAHRFCPTGVALVHSTQLPFPDSGVSATVEVHAVQDLMVIEWPQIGMTYDISSYQLGTLAFRAPAWSGAITNIIA
jgi:hypothetical protein